METTFATANTPGKANEDYAVCGPRWAVILDGATAPEHIDSGCIHDVPWLVRHLAAGITQHLMLDNALSLPDILANTIKTTTQAHEDTCDLSNPDSPSSTVAIIRVRGSHLDYLVLGDSPVILRADQKVRVIKDDRTDHLPGGRPYTYELVTRMRNKSGGFWIASTNPEAAYQAVSGNTNDVTNAAMLTDGVTRLVDFYGYDWRSVLAVLDSQGPSGLISRVRTAERESPPPHGKVHDDATAIYARSLFPAEDAATRTH
jgi:hypothetical protein